MSNSKHPLSPEEFDSVYSKVPRLTVEIIIRDGKRGIYLTKRAIEPCKGQWHLPGGTVRFGETLIDAVKRIAVRELGVSVSDTKLVGYIEYPSHFNNGLDSPVGLAFEVLAYDSQLKPNHESVESGWFTKLPSPMHAEQDVFLLSQGYLIKN